MNPVVRLLDTPVRTAMAVSALMMAHQVAGKAARDGIFLSHFSATSLPTMVVAAALAALVTSLVRGHALVRLGPFRITVVSFAASGALHAGEWLLLSPYPRFTACVIYLHIVAFGAILLSGFWSLMNEQVDPWAAKPMFARIHGIGTLGGLAGGIIAERVVAWTSSSALIQVLAVLHLACAAVLWYGFRKLSTQKVSSHPPVARASGVQAVRRYPFLLTLACLVMTTAASAALLDFLFKAQAASTLGKGEDLVRAFGIFYTVTSLLIFLVQTFIVPWALQRIGLVGCVSSLPIVTGAGSLTSLIVPGFGVLAGARASEALVRGSLFRSAYELFYTAVPPSDKRAAKSFIDVGADRIGDALGAGLIQLILVLTPGQYTGILLSAFGCSLLAALLTFRLRAGYLLALEKSLLHRAVELDPALVEDSTTRSVLMNTVAMERPGFAQARREVETRQPQKVSTTNDSFIRVANELRCGDVRRVVQALEGLGPDDWAIAPLAIKLLAWDPASQAARDALRRMAAKITGLLIDVLLDNEQEFAIRRRVPRILVFNPSPRAADGLLAALDDQRFEVRFYSARALWLMLRDHVELSVPQPRIWAVVDRELGLQKSVWQSHRLLDNRESDAEWFFDEELRDRADRNLEHVFTLLALLLPLDAVLIAFRALHTDDRQLRGTAFEYLQSATPPGTRRRLLQVLEADAELRVSSPDPNIALANLLQSRAQISQQLSRDAEREAAIT